MLEKPFYDVEVVLSFVSSHGQPSDSEVIRAFRNGAGTKIGTVLGGTRALEMLLKVREVGGEITFRMSNRHIPLGETITPDLRLASLVMLGSERFTGDAAWEICELAGYDETPEEMTERITGQAWRMVNVVQHVPMPVAAATLDLLRTRGFSNVGVRQAVPRKK
ncbi:MAG: hypothetical protein J0H98_07210 [Solirubrobacterales bacterium]|nr:hypothetical protein [Solirubrobacterales bacterium]